MPLQTGRAFCMAQYFYKVSLRWAWHIRCLAVSAGLKKVSRFFSACFFLFARHRFAQGRAYPPPSGFRWAEKDQPFLFCLLFLLARAHQSRAYLLPSEFYGFKKDCSFLFCLLFSFRKASLCPGSGIPAAWRLLLGRKRLVVSFLLTFFFSQRKK